MEGEGLLTRLRAALRGSEASIDLGGALRIKAPEETTRVFSRNAMHCDRCHSPVPDDATIWRVSVGYSVTSQPLLGGVQSWCAACASQFDHRNNLWSEAENWPVGAW